jgi:hypothetical protein
MKKASTHDFLPLLSSFAPKERTQIEANKGLTLPTSKKKILLQSL